MPQLFEEKLFNIGFGACDNFIETQKHSIRSNLIGDVKSFGLPLRRFCDWTSQYMPTAFAIMVIESIKCLKI